MSTATYYVTVLAGPKVAGKRVAVGDSLVLTEEQARSELLAGALTADPALVQAPFGPAAGVTRVLTGTLLPGWTFDGVTGQLNSNGSPATGTMFGLTIASTGAHGTVSPPFSIVIGAPEAAPASTDLSDPSRSLNPLI